jgi:hypothetical protein
MVEKEKRSFLLKTPNNRFLDRYTYTRYAQYKRDKKVSKENGVDLRGYKKIGAEIFREIGNQLVEREGGVFIKNFGYFFNARLYYSGIYNLGNGNYIFQPLYKNRVFRPLFIADASNIEHTFWNIEGKFSATITSRIGEKVKNGKRYKAYFHTMRPLLNINLSSKNMYHDRMEQMSENLKDE